jgi:glycosyltransferase involved in cell wall biosynthesis
MPLHIAIDARHLKDFGVGTYIRNLIRAMAGIEHSDRFSVVVFPSDTRELPGLPENFHVLPYPRLDTDPLDQVAFPLFLRRLGADVYHIPLNRVPLLMPRPFVVTIHDMSSLIFREHSGYRGSLRLYLFRRGLVRADKVIAVSAATRRDVESLLGVPQPRIRQIYNAIDPRFLLHMPPADARAAGPQSEILEKRRILERYQIHYPFLLYAGTIRPQKNISRLVEAFAVLRGDLEGHPKYKELRLIIIGDEISRYPAVRRAVIQTRADKVVRFLGFVPIDTLRIFYSAAEAFVFPSLYEGFGLPPLEAMASGTPVVCSGISSLPEVVGDAAVIVNPENVFDIARGIREVLLDEALRRRLIDHGYDQLRNFSWESTARQVLETYREVASFSRESRLSSR